MQPRILYNASAWHTRVSPSNVHRESVRIRKISLYPHLYRRAYLAGQGTSQTRARSKGESWGLAKKKRRTVEPYIDAFPVSRTQWYGINDQR